MITQTKRVEYRDGGNLRIVVYTWRLLGIPIYIKRVHYDGRTRIE